VHAVLLASLSAVEQRLREIAAERGTAAHSRPAAAVASEGGREAISEAGTEPDNDADGRRHGYCQARTP
jgi:hypothetical protein